jgi:hypothetical protein
MLAHQLFMHQIVYSYLSQFVLENVQPSQTLKSASNLPRKMRGLVHHNFTTYRVVCKKLQNMGGWLGLPRGHSVYPTPIEGMDDISIKMWWNSRFSDYIIYTHYTSFLVWNSNFCGWMLVFVRSITDFHETIRRPAGVSDWKVLFLILFLVCTCSFVLLLRVFASSESSPPPLPPPT